MQSAKPQSNHHQAALACGCVHCRGHDARQLEPMADQWADRWVDRWVERSVSRAVFASDAQAARFAGVVGQRDADRALASVFPMAAATSAIKEELSKRRRPEKQALNIGFVPITCATPIIVAHAHGLFREHGLHVSLVRTAGWALARERALAGEYDAAHMLTPMPLAMTLGVGSPAADFHMPTVENLNGQAITLHVKHADKRDPRQWHGLKFAVPFDYSMHNFLLRYYVAEHGLDPDRDIHIRVLAPQDMVASLHAGHIDGYLAPDPYNQRAVHDGAGFIHLLTRDIWPGHPCCGFAASATLARDLPDTFAALVAAIVQATHQSADATQRQPIARIIAAERYLDQPVEVVEQVLTGRFHDGVGQFHDTPDRIDFEPFPWQSTAVWILTQMKRWGYIDGDIDYAGIAREVYRTSDCEQALAALGHAPQDRSDPGPTIMGRHFDWQAPEAYLNSFAIRRT